MDVGFIILNDRDYIPGTYTRMILNANKHNGISYGENTDLKLEGRLSAYERVKWLKLLEKTKKDDHLSI